MTGTDWQSHFHQVKTLLCLSSFFVWNWLNHVCHYFFLLLFTFQCFFSYRRKELKKKEADVVVVLGQRPKRKLRQKGRHSLFHGRWTYTTTPTIPRLRRNEKKKKDPNSLVYTSNRSYDVGLDRVENSSCGQRKEFTGQGERGSRTGWPAYIQLPSIERRTQKILRVTTPTKTK